MSMSYWIAQCATRSIHSSTTVHVVSVLLGKQRTGVKLANTCFHSSNTLACAKSASSSTPTTASSTASTQVGKDSRDTATNKANEERDHASQDAAGSTASDVELHAQWKSLESRLLRRKSVRARADGKSGRSSRAGSAWDAEHV
jgi:hypothetical protein